MAAERVSVPRDMGLVLLRSPEPDGKFAGIYYNPDPVGAAAVDMVIGLMHRHEAGLPAHAHEWIINGTWVDGTSLPPRSASPNTAKARPRTQKRRTAA